MPFIIKTPEVIFGPFQSIEKSTDRYICDNEHIPFQVVENEVIEEVSSNWVHPGFALAEAQKFNAEQRKKREEAYPVEADPIFFKSQRGEATQEEWLAKVAEIKQRFPYREV